MASIFRKSINKIFYSPNEENFDLCMSFIEKNKIKGDYAEFGVFSGNSIIIAHHFSKVHKLKMKFYGFDSFEGLPEPIKEEKILWKKGDYSYPIEKVKSNLKLFDIDFKLVKGWYKDTLTGKENYGIKKLSFAHIDCDLYESAKQALNFIEPYLQKGTIILFDDFNTIYSGDKKAFEEFKRKNNVKFIEIPVYNLKNKVFYCLK